MANLDIIIRAQNQASAALRQVEGQLSSIQRTASRGFGGLQSALGVGVKAAAGVGLVGIGALGVGIAHTVSDGLALNRTFENVEAQLTAFTGSGEKAQAILEDIRTEAALTPFAFEEMAEATAMLLPAAKQSGQELMTLVKQAEILAALNPGEGLAGAAFSLREALSGDFVSIVDRFNLPRQRLNELKEQGVPAMEAISIALQEMGVDASLVSNMALTFDGRMSTFKDSIDSLKVSATKPIFDIIKNQLSKLQPVLDANMPMLAAMADAFGQQMADKITRVVDALPAFINNLWDMVGAFSAFIDGARKFLAPLVSMLAGFVSWKDVLIAIGIVLGAMAVSFALSIAPILAVAAALVGAVALIRNAWENDWGGIQAKTQSAIAIIQPLLNNARDWLETNIPAGLAILRAKWDEVWPALSSAFATAWVTIETGISTAKTAIETNIPAGLAILRAKWDEVWPALSSAFATAWATIETGIFTAKTAIETNIPTALTTLQTAWDTVWGALPGIFTTAKDAITSGVETVKGWFADDIPGALTDLQSTWDTVTSAIQTAWGMVVDFLQPTIDKIIEAFPKMIESFAPVGDKLKELWDVAGPVILKLNAFFGVALIAAVRLFGETIAAVMPHVGTVVGLVIDALILGFTFANEALDALLLAFQENWPAIQSAIETAWDSIKLALDAAYTWFTVTLPESLTTLVEFFTPAMTRIKEALDTAGESLQLLGDKFSALWTTAEPVITALVGAVALIRNAWENDWGGIQGIVQNAANNLQPVFDRLRSYLDMIKGGDWGGLTKAVFADVSTILQNAKATIEEFDWADWIGGVLEWAVYVGKLAWADWIGGVLEWAVYVGKLAWDVFLQIVDWQLFIWKLEWNLFVKALDWAAGFVASLPWADYVTTLSNWGVYVGALAWKNFVSVLTWGSEYIQSLDWAGFITTLGNWGQWIASLDWTKFITTIIDWFTWIPALTWNSFVMMLDWATIVVAFAWTEWISKLTWADFVAALSWGGDKVSKLEWSDFVAVFSWVGKVADFAWNAFVSKLEWPLIAQFDWAGWIDSFVWPTLPSFSWSSWIASFNWPTLPTINWASFIPSFSWPSIPSFPGWGAILGGIGAEASGTGFFGGGLTLVGERGPEVVMLPRGSRIESSERTERMMGGGVTVNVYATVSGELDIEEMAYRVAQTIQRRGR